MTLGTLFGRTGRMLALSTAVVGTLALTAAPQPAHALGPGAAVGIGLGALALGTAVGAATANPYYYGYPGYYPGYYAQPAPAYPAYYGYAPGPARSCWNPYYGRYYAC